MLKCRVTPKHAVPLEWNLKPLRFLFGSSRFWTIGDSQIALRIVYCAAVLELHFLALCLTVIFGNCSASI